MAEKADIVVGTKVTPSSFAQLKSICKKYDFTVYDLLQMLIDCIIRYMDEYLQNLKRAMEEGIPVLGYQHWSLMDNFEWAMGYSRRFGLIYVDYVTQERTLKDSAYFYSEVIKTNGENL